MSMRPGGQLRGHIRRLDRRLMSRSSRARSHRLDRALVAVTHAASYSRLWLLIAAALAAGGGRRARGAAAGGLIATGIAAVVVNGPAKWLVHRRRPSPRFPPPLIKMPRSTSFPSGHSASAFAFATGASGELPILAVGLVPLATTVAYSRVHAGVHYPSDVAAGAAIGIGAGVLTTRLRCVLPGSAFPLRLALRPSASLRR
jgi:membrane-associated phospholipid phosphatase